MPDCYATNAWPMLWSEGGWILNLRLDPLVGRIPYKMGTLTLQDARLPCDKRMTYAAVGGGLYTEHAIRLPDRKGSMQKRASRLCRMPDYYAISAWPMLRSEEVWTLSLRLASSVGRIWI